MMRPRVPADLAAGMLVWQLRRSRDSAVGNVGFWLGLCVEDLTAVADALSTSTAAVPDREARLRAVEGLRATLQRCAAAITAGQATYSTLSDLCTAARTLRFVRPEPATADIPDTDNPLYNITVWLIDAISGSATLLHAQEALDTAARYGYPDDAATT
ncbi:hypothetical protein OHA72_10515 [Dactylosporangium sp. NBC_01737]|uniref:hypothetical protein n=1 Tax=Dactylosporangium sp. NBC_01737 TaxID=2975959 RepID=UPI002E111A92|nr:hypothetical protein OHA72_10515 [Dactylosporangium sp. NBC_01737]